MKLYRCLNCGREFEAERPACVECKIDPRENPRFAQIIVPLETVHFDPPTHVPGIGHGHVACNPRLPIYGLRATGDPLAANCKLCRETPEWQEASARAGSRRVAQEDDFEAEPATGTG